jgi:hypothetical protein
MIWKGCNLMVQPKLYYLYSKLLAKVMRLFSSDKKTISAKDFSPHIFWDYHIHLLDMKRDKGIIIERALMYGYEKDERLIYDYYSEAVIKSVIKKSPNLNRLTASYMSVVLNIPLEKFKCYKSILLTNPY